MNSHEKHNKTTTDQNDRSTPDSSSAQINPCSLMTASNLNEVQISDTRSNTMDVYERASSSEKTEDFIEKPSAPIDDQLQRTVAAWVRSSAQEISTSPMERSPSLPTTLIDPILDRERRVSVVSTAIDQQQNQETIQVSSEAFPSTPAPQRSSINDIQRSYSFPLAVDSNKKSDDILLIANPDEFRAVPESEDSEVERSGTNMNFQYEFCKASGDNRQKSVSFDSQSITRRSLSLNESTSSKNRQNKFIKPRSKHFEKYEEAPSDRSPSIFSENAFQGISPSISSPFSHPQSLISTEQLNSNISETVEEVHEENESSLSSRSSRTPSTESLVKTSSDDEFHGNSFQTQFLHATKNFQDLRRDLLRKLTWLLARRSKISFISAYATHKTSPEIGSQSINFRNTTNSSNTINESSPILFGSLPNDSSQHYISLPSQFSNLQITSPPNSPTFLNDELLSTKHSDIHPSSPLFNSHSESLSSSLNVVRSSLSNSLNLPQRKRVLHNRKNLSGLAANSRDRKNSFNRMIHSKPDDPSNPSININISMPLKRDIKAILEEHLKMILNIQTNPQSSSFSLQFLSQNASAREFFYRHLMELSSKHPMKERCSRFETKVFIDSITNYHMNRSNHYTFLIDYIRKLSENKMNSILDPSLDDSQLGNRTLRDASDNQTPMTNNENEQFEQSQLFKACPLRYFRTLSPSYIQACEQAEKELTQKIFDIADKQHIFYCLKHIDSGHTNDLLTIFHRRLDAIFVWYNLYYELTISIKKLSGLLRCDECDDWPKLHFRSLATERERKAKRAIESDDTDYYTSTEESSNEKADDESEILSTEDKIERQAEKEMPNPATDEHNDVDLLPRSNWSEEALDRLNNLKLADDGMGPADSLNQQTLSRRHCYRNFVYYMDKRSYQVKYDGLARTLIERVAPVLAKTRLALLNTENRSELKVETVVGGLTLSDLQSIDKKVEKCHNTDTDDTLMDTDNPVEKEVRSQSSIGELTIEAWLSQVLKSCPTLKTISTHLEEILKENWLELHEQLGLPSLLPLYFFTMNVLLDVMDECLALYNNTYTHNQTIEIDALCRQQLVREAKLVLRDALATRLYAVRMMQTFISNRKMIDELVDYDNKIVSLYKHYKQYLSTVSINRTFATNETNPQPIINSNPTEFYYFVDEETSELIKEYYFARDLTLTLGNREVIHDFAIQFSELVRGILTQLNTELNVATENYYQAFVADTCNVSNSSDAAIPADVTDESHRTTHFHTSVSTSSDSNVRETSLNDSMTLISEQKKSDIILSTREFRRSFDIIKQRTIRICSLAKTLIQDFCISAEFKCPNYADLWLELSEKKYVQVKLNTENSSSDEIDTFNIFVPYWLAAENATVERILNAICSEQSIKQENDSVLPSFLVFIPKPHSYSSDFQWQGDIIRIRACDSLQLALNSTESRCLHLAVGRSDQLQKSIELFLKDVSTASNSVKYTRKIARDEEMKWTFDQLPEQIHELSDRLNNLVGLLNTIWDQQSIKIFLTEFVKFDERQLRTIESKLLDLVLYVYNSGFELFRLLHELLTSIVLWTEEKTWRKFVSVMNNFFCEWCKCVTKKFKNTLNQQNQQAKFKVLRPRWFRPGMVFLGFLAQPQHLEVLSLTDYKRLMTEMPEALKALRGNTMKTNESAAIKSRTDSASSLVNASNSKTKSRVSSNIGHRRGGSAGTVQELISNITLTPMQRIQEKVQKREQEIEQKLRLRKQIGQELDNRCSMSTSTNSSTDPTVSLRIRNIDFPWRRGTRIGQGGAGVAFRAINSLNGAIVCMKEIQLSSIASRALPSTYPEKVRRIAEEIKMIMLINHPNIVRYFGIETYKRTIYICMEYCLSTVNEFLSDIRAFQDRAKHRKLSCDNYWSDSSDHDEDVKQNALRLSPALDINELVRGFVKQLLQALLVLHEKQIIHCDVKGDNIFIANENGCYIVKLGDFNLSYRLDLESPSNDSESRSTQFGTLYFKPPESEYVYESDIWALGCTVIEMLTGKLPWSNVVRQNEERIYIQTQLSAKKGPPIPEEIKEQTDACNFIQRCLIPDFLERPSAKVLLDDPYPRVLTDS